MVSFLNPDISNHLNIYNKVTNSIDLTSCMRSLGTRGTRSAVRSLKPFTWVCAPRSRHYTSSSSSFIIRNIGETDAVKEKVTTSVAGVSGGIGQKELGGV